MQAEDPYPEIEIVEEQTFDEERFLVSAVGQSDPGLRRQQNEDSFAVLQNQVFVIADGMGGHASGEVASRVCTDVLTASFETQHFGGTSEPDVPWRGDQLVRAIKTANAAIYAQSRQDPKLEGMGTTVVAARFSPNKRQVCVGHVGDSRCYRIRRGVIRQLTIDHTLENAGYRGKGKHRLTRALGVRSDVEVDLLIDTPEGGDCYVLCSDGLSKMLSDDRIRDIALVNSDIEVAVRALVAEANARGGKDNITVILVRVEDVSSLRELSEERFTPGE